MIVRTLKIRLTPTQEKMFDGWLWNLTGVYNWAVRKVELDARDSIYHSDFNFCNLLAGHSKKLGIPSHVLQGTVKQAYTAWRKCFKKKARKPRLKGKRNKLNSIPFPDPIAAPVGNNIKLPGVGSLRFHKQVLPSAKIKCGRMVKRASGWHLCLWLDYEHKFPVKKTNASVGIDPGFSTLLTLSDGTTFENPRELRKGAERLAQASRANDETLVAKLQERQANRRNDRNHKISRKLVENYATIYYSDDNFQAMSTKFGKSIFEASLGQLIAYLTYKSRTGGRKLVAVNSKSTTMTCSNCGAKTGPAGLVGLRVRDWECGCGAKHDRDVNAARVILKTGAGCALKETSNGLN